MISGSGLPNSFHSDVMEAFPETEEAKVRLVDEIKSRAKACLGASKNYPEAISLYTKAIETAPNAILYGNRSMCHLGMKNNSKALEDASTSATLDPTYAKAFFRKGMAEQALNTLKAAHMSFTRSLELAPADKAVKVQLDKVADSLQRGLGTNSVPSSSSSSTAAKPKPTSKPAGAKKSDSIITSSSTVVENGDGSDLRGYKLTSDGRKTSFFNNEMDEKTKSLIGNIAPKKIEVKEAPPATVFNSEKGSVWNSAGTYEEKMCTPWAKERLEELISGMEVDIPSFAVKGGTAGDTATINVTKVKSVSGDAQISIIRGKRKHIYDMTVELEWSLELCSTEVSKAQCKASGTMTVNDISADGDEENLLEVSKPSSNKIVQGLVQSHVRKTFDSDSAGAGLQAAIHKKLLEFKTELLAK